MIKQILIAMLSTIIILLVALIILCAQVVAAPLPSDFDKDSSFLHGIIIDPGVKGYNPAGVTTDVVKFRKTLDAQFAAHPDHIDIHIASGGGMVTPLTLDLLSQLEKWNADGVVVRCYVTELAASLAAAFLSRCGERYADPLAIILWHSVRAILPPGTILTQFDFEEGAASAAAQNKILWAPLRELIDDDEMFDKALRLETPWPAMALAARYPKALQVVD